MTKNIPGLGYYFVARSNTTWGNIDLQTKQQLKEQVLQRDGSVCSRKNHHGCGRLLEIFELTVDHVIPISRGGPVMDTSNMQLLCRDCHIRKTQRESLVGKDKKSLSPKQRWIRRSRSYYH